VILLPKSKVACLAKRLTFEKWLILEIKPFLKSKPFSPKSALFGKMA